MKRIKSWTDYDVSDVSYLTNTIKVDFLNKWHDVLSVTLEIYLGREFNPEIDKHRFGLISNNDSNQTKLMADGNHIGTIFIKMGNLNGNFIDNKITSVIEFIPIVKGSTWLK